MADNNSIQSLIQSLVPSSVNNGNPNTIYNASMGPVPTTNGGGDWYVPQVNPAANLPNFAVPNLSWLPPPQATGGINLGNLINFHPSTGTGNGWNPMTPPTYPGTPSGGTGGGTGGTATPPATTPQGGYTGGGSGNVGSGYTWDTYGGGTSADFLSGSGNAGGFGGGGNNSDLFDPGHGLWDVAPGLAGSLGMNPNGGMNWKQALDVLSEPFFKGNFYNSQTGTWNWGALAQTLTGIPGMNWLLDLLGKHQLTDNNPNNDDSFFARLLKNKIDNNLTKQNNVMRAQGNNIVSKTNQNLFNNMDWSVAPQTRTGTVSIGDMVNSTTGQVMPYNGAGSVGWNGAAISGWTPGGNVGIPDVGIATPVANMNQSFRGANGTMYNGTDAAPAGSTNALANGVRGGADVVNGDAARAMFAGMAQGSDKAIKEALAAEARRAAR